MGKNPLRLGSIVAIVSIGALLSGCKIPLSNLFHPDSGLGSQASLAPPSAAPTSAAPTSVDPAPGVVIGVPGVTIAPTPIPVASPLASPVPPAQNFSKVYPTNGFNLAAGQSITLGDNTRLTLTTSGDLQVIAAAGTLLWDLGSVSDCSAVACSAAFQNDGNFVLYAAGSPYWATGTYNNGGATLKFANSVPYLQIISAAGAQIWTSNPSTKVVTAAPISTPNTILGSAIYPAAGLTLAPRQSVALPGGTKLMLTASADLEVLDPSGAVAWHSSTSNGCADSGCKAVFQNDGNLVVTGTAGQGLWSTGTFGHNGASLTFSANQPYLVIADTNGGSLWSSGGASAVAAVSANDFLNSLGVNTHVDQGFDPNSYVGPLLYLGVRNVRDGYRNAPALRMLHQVTGVRFDIGSYYELGNLLAAARVLAASDSLMAIEGPNEPNNFGGTYNGVNAGGSGTWLGVAQFQRDLYAAVKSDSVLSRYPVFSVSEVGAETDNVGLQFLTIPTGAGALLPDGTHFADYVNPHNYVSSTGNRYVNNQAWQAADPILNSVWDGIFGSDGVTWAKHIVGYSAQDLATLPRVTTETGWDSVGNPGGEPVQGTVLVNTYLSQFKRGYRYTFIYELGDAEGSTGNQGLYRPDHTPKLAATYIHNLTTILADNAAVGNPGSLAYTIANPPATVHDLLLRKSNGAFELVIWDENTSGTDNVTVSFGAARASVKVYDVTSGVTPTQSLSNVTSVALTLKDHPLIIELP